jgi:hypothetical protein
LRKLGRDKYIKERNLPLGFNILCPICNWGIIGLTKTTSMTDKPPKLGGEDDVEQIKRPMSVLGKAVFYASRVSPPSLFYQAWEAPFGVGLVKLGGLGWVKG